MAKRRPTEKTPRQRSAPSKPSRQERRQAARNDAKAKRTVETSYPLPLGSATASSLPAATSYSRQDALALVALGLLVVVPYLPAMLWGGFIWDDRVLTSSQAVQDWSGLWRLWSGDAYTAGDTEEGHYWPLVYTIFWLEHKLWGFDPTGYHIVNVLLHWVNTLLVWHLVRRLAVPGAWMVAAVFAVHPLHVESVAWVIERKDVLSGLFYLAAALAWMRFVEQPRPRRYACSLALYVAALLSKSVAITLPAALLIWHWWKQGRVTSPDLLRLVPFFVVGLVITVGDLAFYRTMETVSLDYSLTERTLIAARALWFYAGKLLWPTNLAVIYPLWDIRVADPLAWGYLVAATALVVALWLFRSQLGRGPLAGALFFAVTLSPLLGFVDYGYMDYAFVADRFQYLAGIGVMAVVIGSATHGIRRLSGLWQKGALGIAGMTLVVLGLLTWRQASIYRDEETFYCHIIALNPQAQNAHFNLGIILYKQGRYEEVLNTTRVAIEQDPEVSEAHVHLGAALHALGRFEEAELYLRRAIALNPQGRNAHFILGDVLYKQGQYEEALDATRVALEQDPDFLTTHINLGAILYVLGRFEEAETHLRRAIALDPQDVGLCRRLAEVLTPQGRYEEAIDVLAQAAALDPASPQAAELHFLMGQVAEENGQPKAAVEYYMRAFEIAPRHAEAVRRLAHLRIEQQRYEEALEFFQRLLAIDPNDAVAYGNMGIALYYLGRSTEALRSFDQALSLDPTLEDARANREAVVKAWKEMSSDDSNR